MPPRPAELNVPDTAKHPLAKEKTAMNTTRRLIATALTAATLFAAYVAAAATATAQRVLPDGDTVTTPPATVITHTGSPWWSFAVVALAACALTLTAALAVTQRQPPPTRLNTPTGPAGTTGGPGHFERRHWWS
jgi:hypothetical protein